MYNDPFARRQIRSLSIVYSSALDGAHVNAPGRCLDITCSRRLARCRQRDLGIEITLGWACGLFEKDILISSIGLG